MSDIMSISRLRMGTDGNGITTLIGFKRCPLSCKYCANRQCHDINTPSADYTPEELLSVLKKDEPYFLMTDGGVTFGGGEPLQQAGFIHELCGIMNKEWNCTIETSLYAEWKEVKKIVSDIDYWYIDLKALDKDIYKSYTGKSNKIVLDNLKRLLEIVPETDICLRLPTIPDYKSKEKRDGELMWIRENISETIRVDCFDYMRM